jgi:hypothetical protein
LFVKVPKEVEIVQEDVLKNSSSSQEIGIKFKQATPQYSFGLDLD